MKRVVLMLAAGAFGSLLALPIAHAQSYEDMNSDASRIQQDKEGIRHDQQDRQEDVERGKYGAAAREQAEIEQKRADKRATKDDLRSDLSNRAYDDRYHHDDDND